MKLLGNRKRGCLFVISAPAGTGKTTLVNQLLGEFPDAIEKSISCTTRQPRAGEKDGVDYYFYTPDRFASLEESGAFLETATVFGNRYGTLKNEVERIRSSGRHAILVIDTQGAESIKKIADPILIFIEPPSFTELKNRLHKRSTETDEQIIERLEWAKKELTHLQEYHYAIINDDLRRAYNVLRSIFIAEEHATKE